MFALLFILILAYVGASFQCVFLYCPPQDVQFQTTVDCDKCSDCGDKNMKFCGSTRNHKCGCVPSPFPSCKLENTTGYEYMSFCHVIGNIQLPPLQVHRNGPHAVAVTVPRFFTDGKYSKFSLANLALYANFWSKDKVGCEPIAHIQASKRTANDCIMRVMLHMPGIDHKTDDAYYYDDGTELESEFAIDLFEKADRVEFWAEVTSTEEMRIDGRLLRFNNVIRSPRFSHDITHHRTTPPPLRESVEHLLRNNETAVGNSTSS